MDEATLKYARRAGLLQGQLESLLITMDAFVLESMKDGWRREYVEKAYNRAKETLEGISEEDAAKQPTVTEILEEAAFARRWA